MLSERKFSHPLEMKETDIEKYLFWKIEKHHIGASYQRLIVASIDKFYLSLFNTQLNIKHLYPHAKNKSLPVYLTTREVSRLMDGVTNLKHKCIVQLLYGTDIRYIQILLGHKSVYTTEIYTHITDIAQSKIKSPLDLL